MSSFRGVALASWLTLALIAAGPSAVRCDDGPDRATGDAPAAPAAAATADPNAVRILSGGVPSGVADLKAMQQHLQRMSDKLLSCTVGIRLGPVRGSGVIVSSEGMVLTAAHVAGKPNVECEVVLADGRAVRARTLGLNRNVDAGLIQILEKAEWPFVEMAKAEPAKVGQWCVATGHPGGYEAGRKPVVRLGRVLEVSDSVLITDCTLVGGDSGGPLFDAHGRVIAVHSRIGNMLAANLHVPVPAYIRSWDRLVKGDAWGHLPGQAPFLGVRGEPDANEAKIAEVFDGMPASKAGLQVGDVVLKLDGQPVGDFNSLSKMVGDKTPEQRVVLEVRRGDQVLQITVVLGKR